MHMSPAHRAVTEALTVAGHMVEFDTGNPLPWVAMDDRGSRAWVASDGTGFKVWADMIHGGKTYRTDYFCPDWPTVLLILRAITDAR